LNLKATNILRDFVAFLLLIFESRELDENSVVRELLTTASVCT